MITENRKKATDVRPETVQKPPEPVADRTDGQAQQNEKTPFPPFRRELDEYLFRQGTAHRAWEYLGAQEEGDQIVFRVWAPHAVQVALVGSFCDWENGIPMQRAGESGLYVLALPQERVPDGALYKYRILGRDGNFHMKADRMAVHGGAARDSHGLCPAQSLPVERPRMAGAETTPRRIRAQVPDKYL